MLGGTANDSTADEGAETWTRQRRSHPAALAAPVPASFSTGIVLTFLAWPISHFVITAARGARHGPQSISIRHRPVASTGPARFPREAPAERPFGHGRGAVVGPATSLRGSSSRWPAKADDGGPPRSLGRRTFGRKNPRKGASAVSEEGHRRFRVTEIPTGSGANVPASL